MEKIKVLIADDDELALMLLRKGIEGPQFEVETVASGEEAVQILSQRDFDIVLSDVSMPRPTGLELTRMIREKIPNTDVIILTASPTMDTVKEALESGAYDYLTKPFDLTLIHAALRRCSEKRALHARLAGGEGPAIAAAQQVGAMKARVEQLKKSLEKIEFGPEHESCRDFAHRLIAEWEKQLSDLG